MAVPTLARTLVPGPMEWIELCRQAETQGFHSVWTGDTAGADAFVDAAYAVAATRSITVGIGVALPTRSPLQTAAAAAALALPERKLILGLGAGNPTVNDGHGITYDPVVARMRDYVGCVTALLRAPCGETVDESRGRARARGHGFGLDGDRLQVVLGAYGPAMTALAGELTDGVLVHLLTPRSKIREHQQAATSRHAGPFLRAAGVLVFVDDDETTATSVARDVLSSVLRVPRFAERLQALAPGSDPAHLDDAVLREFVLVSTPSRLLDEIERFAETDLLIPVPLSLFMAPGSRSERAREAVLAGLLRRSPHRMSRA